MNTMPDRQIPIRVLVVEDQELIRESFEIILSNKPDIQVVGTASNGEEAVLLCEKLVPDIVLLDIRMPKMDGVTACKKIKERNPGIKIIVLTTFDDDEYIYNAIRYGASGYILKDISVDELVSAIHTVWKGGAMLNPNICSKLFQFFSEMTSERPHPPSPTPVAIPQLNATENNIVQLIYQGLSNKEIAHKLFLSEGTVRNSISTILSKLQLRDRTQIALYYIHKLYE